MIIFSKSTCFDSIVWFATTNSITDLVSPSNQKETYLKYERNLLTFIEFIIFQKYQSKHYFKQQTKRILVEPLQFDSMLPWRKKFCLKQNLFFGCNDSLSNSRPISVTCTYRIEDDVWCRHCLFFIRKS